MEHSFEAILRQIKKSAGRFRLPFLERLRTELALRRADLRGEKMDGLPEMNPLIPFNWRILLNYLYKRGMLATPQPVRFPLPPGDPDIYSFYLLHTPIPSDGHYPPYFNRGSSLDLEEALGRTIGEFLERYPLLIYRNRDLLRSSPRQLRKKGYFFLDPTRLAGFSDKQKREHPHFYFDDESQFQWVWGYSLFDRKPCFLPAQLVFWNYCLYGPETPEPLLRERNTNGAAGMFTRGEAVFSGLCELIQRDAFLIYWLNMLSPPRIEISSITYGRIPQLRKLCREHNLELVVLDVTSDLGIPVCFAVLVDRTGNGPCISMGGCCDVSPEKAIERAIEEALGIRLWVKALMLTKREDETTTSSQTKTALHEQTSNLGGQQARVLFWADQNNFRLFQFFLSGNIQLFEAFRKRFATFNHTRAARSHLLNTFKCRGPEYNVYFYESQYPVLAELGYHSVRLLVPALVPFYLNEQHKPLGANRLKEIPSKIGYTASDSGWNQLMHPFP